MVSILKIIDTKTTNEVLFYNRLNFLYKSIVYSGNNEWKNKIDSMKWTFFYC